MNFIIDHTKRLTLADIDKFLGDRDATVELSAASKNSIVRCREYLDQKLKSLKAPVYGINTGFGSLYNVVVPDSDLEQLQENLVKSHACGMGDEVPQEIVR